MCPEWWPPWFRPGGVGPCFLRLKSMRRLLSFLIFSGEPAVGGGDVCSALCDAFLKASARLCAALE